MPKRITWLLAKRLFNAFITLLVIVILIFIITRIAPSTPTRLLLSPDISPALADKIVESNKLSEPFFLQLSAFLQNTFSGNLGYSLSYHQPVIDVIMEFLPFTVTLALIGFLMEVAGSIFLSIYSVKHLGQKQDRITSTLLMILYSIPAMVLGVFLLYIFSVKLDIFPASGISSLGVNHGNIFSRVADFLYHIVLPVITLALGGITILYKFLRDNLVTLYNSDFINRLRAEGFSENRILKKHLLPNAIMPMISVAGLDLGCLLGGALIVEFIFGLPGMGRLMISAINARDFPLVIGCTVLAGFWMVVANLSADLLKYKLDKRLVRGI